MAFELKSQAFRDGEYIPKKYTCDGQDISVPLKWSEPPAGTRNLALVCDDPDAPTGIWVHWVLYGLSPDIRELPEGIPKNERSFGGSKQGRNDFGRIGYGGPCPPWGSTHRYVFKLYALDEAPDLAPGATKKDLMRAIKDHIIQEARIMGLYKR
nr:YbhB/YbcL family Raf kinase inhibitor-like protein [Desulfobacterales bacterium]